MDDLGIFFLGAYSSAVGTGRTQHMVSHPEWGLRMLDDAELSAMPEPWERVATFFPTELDGSYRVKEKA